MTTSVKNTTGNRIQAYGVFMIAWSILDTVIELGIVHELGLDHTRGTIVVCGLGFERKASILRSLLALKSPTHEAIKLINQTTSNARRNTLAHGHVLSSPDRLTFVKRDTDQRLRATQATFTASELLNHTEALNASVEQLQRLLGITDDELNAFVKIGESLAIRSDTSGKPQIS